MEQLATQALLENVRAYLDAHYVEIPPMDTCCDQERLSPRSMCKTMAMPQPAMAGTLSLKEMLRQEDAGFTETLLHLIDKTGEKDSTIYKKANISKQHFSKIRKNLQYRPTKSTAIAFAIALELDMEQTKDLIGRAGYALTNSSKFDLIIRYFIEHKIYDLTEINMTLYEFDQPLLGA